MNKEELYQKLGGIYGGQKELIDDVVNDFNNLKKQNDTLLEVLCMAKQKYNNDKARYRRKAKMYRDRINEAKEYINNCIGIEVKKDLRSILNGDKNE